MKRYDKLKWWEAITMLAVMFVVWLVYSYSSNCLAPNVSIPVRISSVSCDEFMSSLKWVFIALLSIATYVLLAWLDDYWWLSEGGSLRTRTVRLFKSIYRYFLCKYHALAYRYYNRMVNISSENFDAEGAMRFIAKRGEHFHAYWLHKNKR